MLPNINDVVTVNELTELNKALRKSSVGYQTPAAPDAASALSPLVPQSIEATLASATHSMQDIALWPRIPKVEVSNTVHEYAIINEHGQDLDPFMDESGGNSSAFGATASSYERKSVKIKYLAERRSVSDVASLVGIIGSNPNLLAEETERGTMSLLRKLESQLFYGDEDMRSRGFDGIIKQVERTSGARDFQFGGRPFSQNTLDVQGAKLEPTLLNEILGELHSAPRFGRPDVVMCEPRIYSQLIKQSVKDGRHDSLMLAGMGSDGVQTFGAGPQLHVMGPMGPVPVVSASFLHNKFAPPAAAAGVSGRPNTPVASANLASQAQASSFDAAAAGKDHDGFVKYIVVGYNQKGYSAPLTIDDGAAGGIAANNTVKLTFTIADNDNAEYYKIYRTKPAAAADQVDLSTAKLVYELPKVAGNVTPFEDFGVERINGSRMLFMQMDKGVVEFARLLDFLRRPLAETGAAKEFLLMLFGSPVVKIPGKCFSLRGIVPETIL